MLSFPEKPHQPKAFTFQKHSLGKKQVEQRAFQPIWFAKWSWIHYDESSDSAFCHICVKAEGEGKLKASSKDITFIQKGFTNWKDAMEGFPQHEQSKGHQDAVQVMIVLPRTNEERQLKKCWMDGSLACY